MMNKALAIRIAASSILIGATLVGGTASADQSRPSSTSDAGDSKAAARAAAAAEKAIARRDPLRAVSEAETAVASMPREGTYRTLLGQAYLEAGRFTSAETSFSDALSLDPAQPRAALSLTLAQIAQGNQHGARETLAANESLISPADRGLAFALAGDPAAAVNLLEWAVQSGQADAKTRQNLALSYALSGRWVEAKLMASYDLPEAEVTQRIMQWSQFAQPSAPSDQVASLLGVMPAADPGQPAQLALNAAPAPVRMADVVPAPEPEPVVTVAAVFEQAAEIAPEAPVFVAVAATPTITSFEGIQFAAPAEIVQPLPQGFEPAPIQVAAARPSARVFAPAPQPARIVAVRHEVQAPRTGGYVVQLGAFSTPSRVETAWDRAVVRYGELGGYTPSSTTFRTQNATLYRLSLSGFETRREATTLCGRVKAKGGSCFVRSTAGDMPLQWVVKNGYQRMAAR